MLGDPTAGGELLEQGSIKPACDAVVDILDRGLTVAQPGRTQPCLKAAASSAVPARPQRRSALPSRRRCD